MRYEAEFLLALTLTLAIEGIALFLFIRCYLKIGKAKLPDSQVLFSALIASSLTLPYLWFVIPAFVFSYGAAVLVGEILVVLAEAAIYHFTLKLDWRKALLASFACNCASFLLGLAILPALIGQPN